MTKRDAQGPNRRSVRDWLRPWRLDGPLGGSRTQAKGKNSQAARLEFLEERQLLAVFLVKTTSDAAGASQSLRQAITAANANPNDPNDGPDRIEFDIAGAGPYAINLLGALPAITDPVVIDGYTAAGSSVNTDADAFNGVINVRLQGNGGFNGLTLGAGSDGSVVRGLALNRFQSAIVISAGTGHQIQGNVIGTGGAPSGNTDAGVLVMAASSGNTIGGAAPDERNVISNNASDGIRLFGSNNVIQNNLIGTGINGIARLGNARGIFVGTGSIANLIGGGGFEEGNVISGNTNEGVFINTAQTSSDIVNSTLADSVPIPDPGVIEDTITVTGTGTLTDLNVVLDVNHPLDPDLRITLISPDGIEVILANGRGDDQGFNYFNTRFDDQALQPISALNSTNGPNGSFRPDQPLAALNGRQAQGTYRLRIEDATPGNEGDIGLLFWQLQLTRALADNTIQGNFIGVGADGATGSSNGGDGISINSAPGNLVGGLTFGEGNVISGNGGNGVVINSGTAPAVTNRIEGNIIGLTNDQGVRRANAGDGVRVNGATANLNVIEGNVISGNTGDGVELNGINNRVVNNVIGDGLAANLGNGMEGIRVNGLAHVITDNQISGNANNGVFVTAAAVTTLTSNFSSTDTPILLNSDGDGGGPATDPANVTTSTITIADTSLITDLNVTVRINHTFVNDLRLTLIAPDGIRIPLMARRGGLAVNMNVTFDDQAAQSITTVNPGPIMLTGTFRPESPLNILNGRPLDGDYTLEIVDLIPNNPRAGDNPNNFQLLSWSLRAQTQTTVDHDISGNRIGVDASGGGALANGRSGILIESAGGIKITDNTISGNNRHGIELTNTLGFVSGNTIDGNRIGVDVNGTAPIGNALDGILLNQSYGQTITDNIIGFNRNGISFQGSIGNAVVGPVVGNIIGTEQAPNLINGVLINGMSNVTIGGPDAADGNVIAFNFGAGVAVTGAGTNNRILSNRIFENAEPGIDIGANGTTAADLAAAPVVLNAVTDNGVTTFTGTITGLANTTYVIQFFANANLAKPFTADANDFLGSATVVTDAAGVATIDAAIANPNNLGPFFTATGTPNGGNTTELSLVYPTADLSVVVSNVTAPGNLGANVTYTATVSNAGPGPAFNTILRIPIPLGADFVSVDQPNFTIDTQSVPGQTVVVVDLGTLANGATIPVTVTVFPKAATTFNPSAGVMSGTIDLRPTDPGFILATPDLNLANNGSIGGFLVRSGADLKIEIDNFSSSTFFVGESFTYDLVVTNLGTDAAATVFAFHRLPAGLAVNGTLRAFNPDMTPNNDVVLSRDNGNIVGLLNFLAAGGSFIIRVPVQAVGSGAMTLNASTILNDFDSNVAGPPSNNNLASETITLTPASGSFEFGLASASVSEAASAGFTFQVRRTGGSIGLGQVTLRISGGTATSGADFNFPITQTLTFANGETVKDFTINLTDDAAFEGSETIILSLVNPGNGSMLGTRTTLTVTLTDNDTAPPAAAPPPSSVTPPPASGGSTGSGSGSTLGNNNGSSARGSGIGRRISPFANQNQGQGGQKKTKALPPKKKLGANGNANKNGANAAFRNRPR